jgi:hypothetical protein
MCFAFPSRWDLHLVCPSVAHVGLTGVHIPVIEPKQLKRVSLCRAEAGEPKPDSSLPTSPANRQRYTVRSGGEGPGVITGLLS